MDERELMDRFKDNTQYLLAFLGTLVMLIMLPIIMGTIILSGLFSITYLPNSLAHYWSDWRATIRIMWRM